MTDPPTQAGDLWMVTWARQYGSIPYRQEQAIVMLQAETGAVQAFSLSFPAAPPAVGAGSVTSTQATQTALWGESCDLGTKVLLGQGTRR